MCRSIKVLRKVEGAPASEQELHEAALQFVRKISGYRVPSQTNAEVFEAAVRDVTASSRRLLEGLAPSKRVPAGRPSRRHQDRVRPRVAAEA